MIDMYHPALALLQIPLQSLMEILVVFVDSSCPSSITSSMEISTYLHEEEAYWKLGTAIE
jgi:hypothetical protein